MLLAAASPDPQPSPSPAPSPRAARFFDTAAVTARAVDESPSSVMVLSAEELSSSGAANAAELLLGRPGLLVLPAGGRGAGTQLLTRGGDPNFTLVLLDGVPLNDATDTQGGLVSLTALPLGEVERVELVRGPVSAVYGSAGLSGALQLSTVAGSARPGWSPRAALEAGNASLLETRVGLGLQQGPTRAFVGGGWADESGRVAEETFAQWSASGSLTRELPGGLLALRAGGQGLEADDYPESSGGSALGDGQLRHTQSWSGRLAARLELGRSGSFLQRLDLQAFEQRRERRSPAIVPIVPASQEDARYGRFRLAWQGSAELGSHVLLTTGLGLEREGARNQSRLELPPELGGAVSGDYDARRWVGGPYLEVRRAVGATALEAGLRLDLSDGSREWSPRLGLSRRLSPRARLRASLGRAFKLPSFFAMSSPRALGGNPDLLPESGWSGELGLDLEAAGGRVRGQVTWFDARYLDLVDFSFEEFQHVNRERTEARGLEAALALAPGASLGLEADLTWQRASAPGSTDELLQRPDFFGVARLRWQPRERLALRLELSGVSSYADRQLPAPGRTSVPGYALLGASARLQLRPGLALTVRGDNLFDRDYETYIGFPGPGRALRAGLAWARP